MGRPWPAGEGGALWLQKKKVKINGEEYLVKSLNASEVVYGTKFIR